VMERPNYECVPALIFTEHDEGLPLFRMEVEGEKITITPADDTEPHYNIFLDGFDGVLPARNQNEAYDWARSFHAKLQEHYSKQAV
jgi:hypothetical protein